MASKILLFIQYIVHLYFDILHKCYLLDDSYRMIHDSDKIWDELEHNEIVNLGRTKRGGEGEGIVKWTWLTDAVDAQEGYTVDQGGENPSYHDPKKHGCWQTVCGDTNHCFGREGATGEPEYFRVRKRSACC